MEIFGAKTSTSGSTVSFCVLELSLHDWPSAFNTAQKRPQY